MQLLGGLFVAFSICKLLFPQQVLPDPRAPVGENVEGLVAQVTLLRYGETQFKQIYCFFVMTVLFPQICGCPLRLHSIVKQAQRD